MVGDHNNMERVLQDQSIRKVENHYSRLYLGLGEKSHHTRIRYIVCCSEARLSNLSTVVTIPDESLSLLIFIVQ